MPLAAVALSTPARLMRDEAPPELPVVNRTVFDRTAGFLSAETVAAHLRTIVRLGDEFLLRHREEAVTRIGDELAMLAHKLTGSADLFGFERLAAISRRFKEAVRYGLGEVPDLAATVEATLAAIRDLLPVVGKR